MKKIKQLIALITILVMPAIALASPPAIPLFVYGDVTIDGQPAPVETEISAEIENTEITVVTKTAKEGKYYIEIPDGKSNIDKTILFKVNGIAVADKNYKVADVNITPSVKFDLAVATTRACPILNGQGVQTWNDSNWGDCILESCNSGYHQKDNSCVIDSTTGGGGAVGDETAPRINNVKVNISKTAVVISWQTNEPSISWISYGTSTDYGKEAKTANYTTFHSVSIKNLLSATIYHYQIKSKDSAGNVGQYTDKTFTISTGQIKGDINDDGKVNKYDFALMMSEWGKTGLNIASDLNDDGKVDKYDFSLLMINWSI